MTSLTGFFQEFSELRYGPQKNNDNCHPKKYPCASDEDDNIDTKDLNIEVDSSQPEENNNDALHRGKNSDSNETCEWCPKTFPTKEEKINHSIKSHEGKPADPDPELLKLVKETV